MGFEPTTLRDRLEVNSCDMFDESVSLRFSVKISALNNFFKVKKGNIGDLPDFDFFKLASLTVFCLTRYVRELQHQNIDQILNLH